MLLDFRAALTPLHGTTLLQPAMIVLNLERLSLPLLSLFLGHVDLVRDPVQTSRLAPIPRRRLGRPSETGAQNRTPSDERLVPRQPRQGFRQPHFSCRRGWQENRLGRFL